jgi:hypothetical protein
MVKVVVTGLRLLLFTDRLEGLKRLTNRLYLFVRFLVIFALPGEVFDIFLSMGE